MNNTQNLNDTQILYLNDKPESDLSGHYLHIYGVRIVNDCLNVCVYSDSAFLDMRLNGRLCQRQKSEGIFDFYEPLEAHGLTDIYISSVKEPDLCSNVSVEV